MRKILRVIDLVNERAGSISSWLVAVLVVVILYEVIARYVFNSPTSWAFGSFRMLGGAIVVLGWAYAQLHDSHIRVDVLYNRFPPRIRALLDVMGTGLFFFPFIFIFIEEAVFSYGGVPSVALLYKTVVLIGLCLFLLQFVARFTRDLYLLTRGKTL